MAKDKAFRTAIPNLGFKFHYGMSIELISIYDWLKQSFVVQLWEKQLHYVFYKNNFNIGTIELEPRATTRVGISCRLNSSIGDSTMKKNIYIYHGPVAAQVPRPPITKGIVELGKNQYFWLLAGQRLTTLVSGGCHRMAPMMLKGEAFRTAIPNVGA